MNLQPVKQRSVPWFNIVPEITNHNPSELSRPMDYTLSIEQRFKNGLGFPITIIREDGTYWVLPCDSAATSGIFEIECIVKFREGVNFGDRELEQQLDGRQYEAKELIRAAITTPTASTTFGGVTFRTWRHVVSRDTFAKDESIYIPSLNIVASTISTPQSMPAHPTSMEELVKHIGDASDVDARGAFIVDRSFAIPDLYIHYSDRGAEVPRLNMNIEDGIYVYERHQGEVKLIKLKDKNDYSPLSASCIFPLYPTKDEARKGTWERQEAERKRGEDEQMAEIKRLREELKLEREIQSLKEKDAIESRASERKEYYAERSYERQESLDLFKTVLGLATVGFGIWKLVR